MRIWERNLFFLLNLLFAQHKICRAQWAPCSAGADSSLLYELWLVSVFVLKYEWKSAVRVIFILLTPI